MGSLAEELRALVELHADGALSDAELADAKAAAIGAAGPAKSGGAARAADDGGAMRAQEQQRHRRLQAVAAHVVASANSSEQPRLEGQATPSIREATIADIPSLAAATHYSRLYSFTDRVEDWIERGAAERNGRQELDDQVYGAFVGEEAVATLLSHPWRCGGGSSVEFGAIAGVATIPEYRRLGLLRAMATTLFAEMRSRGQPVAALWASQSAIYQRYGFVSVPSRSYNLDTTEITFVDGDGGSCR